MQHPMKGVDRSRIKMRSNHATVLFSGGLDSTVALWWALYHYPEVTVVIVDYGQKHRQELKAAERIVGLTYAKVAKSKLQLPTLENAPEQLFFRGHSALLVGVAAQNVGREGGDIILGSLRTDPFPDSQPEYVSTLADGLAGPDDQGPVSIVQPLLSVANKAAVVLMGFEFGAPINLSWSCRGSSSKKTCGNCLSCQSRVTALAEASTRSSRSTTEIASWQAVLGSPSHPQFGLASTELQTMASEVIEAGGLTKTVEGRRYKAPDGTHRIAPFVRPARSSSRRKSAGANRHIRATGLTPDTQMPWEVVICEDGSVACTEELPPLALIEKAVLKSLERIGGTR